MNDPFDLLRDQLVAAAGRRPSRARRRGLLGLLVAFVLAGGGVATALVLQTEPSQPPRGGGPGFRYAVELRPDLTAGHIGWCSSARVRGPGNAGGGGSGCGPAPGPERPLIIGGGLSGGAGSVFALVVSSRVVAVQLPGGRRITPRSDPGVPAPWRLVVVTGAEVAPGMRFLDRDGRPIPQDDARDSWASGRGQYPTQRVSAADPPDRPCAIRAGRLAGLRAVSARLLVRYPAVAPTVAEPAFLSCATTVFYLGRTRLRAAVLVNAMDVTAPAALLPGMTSEPSGLVATSDLMSAKRAGPGWLAVFGGTAAQRAALLRVLSATP